MSRRARARPDKRAQAFALALADEPLQLHDGTPVDLRAPWSFPRDDEPPIEDKRPPGPLDMSAPHPAAR